MVELVPLSLTALLRRALTEIERNDAVFDLPLSKGFFGSREHDFSVTHHGRRASSPLGPAAGPQSQMAQNIALSWLGGSRFIELKTVQILDQLEIPRPCIDLRTVGYNVEWSQELRVEQSIEEYVKAAMLVRVLEERLADRLAPDFRETLYDISVGYDLAGIRSTSVRSFLDAMRDCRKHVEHQRAQLPAELAAYRDLDFPTRISDTLTLSTFHGCPSDEIEAICEHLLREEGLNVVVKLNPTLLGPQELEYLLHEVMGYDSIRVPAAVYERDTTWEEAKGFIERLSALADQLGQGFGVKLTNTLVVEHEGEFLPGKLEEKYLSGAPLHVLAMKLVARLRQEFGPQLALSFSAGIDRHNFSDAVALGLVPVTTCTDLLRPGGYGRQAGYYRSLMDRMDAHGARNIDELIAAEADGSDPTKTLLASTERYVEAAIASPRYRLEKNRKPPKKIGSELELFDCITCDKCIPVCPNDANFALSLAPVDLPIWHWRLDEGSWRGDERGVLKLEMTHQIAQFADFCNECGNCDVFCPEDGGPYVVKPRFFGTEGEFETHNEYDGFFVRREGESVLVRARFEGREFRLVSSGTQARFGGENFEVEFGLGDPSTLHGEAEDGVEVDLTYALIMEHVQRAVLDPKGVNYVSVGS
jgi:putative selenate reductase